jgi:transcription antitermination protein NusB
MSLAPDCRSELLVRRTDQRRAAVFICYQRDVTGAPVDDLIDRGVPAATSFTRELVEGVEGHRDELDDLIEEHAIGWHLNRIAPLERAILRTALFEILHRPDVPDEVAIDEAVETAKLYCGAEAPPFLNGILAGALERVRHA